MVEMTVNICASLSNQDHYRRSKEPAEEDFGTYESSDMRALTVEKERGW